MSYCSIGGIDFSDTGEALLLISPDYATNALAAGIANVTANAMILITCAFVVISYIKCVAF